MNAPSAAIVPSGQTLVRFETNGPLDFQNLTYLVVFNTLGNANQPYAQGYNTDFKNWTYFFIVGGGSNFANFPGLEQVYQDPTSGTSRGFNVSIPTGAMNFQTTIPSGSSQYGFQITFNRCLLDQPPPSATAPPPLTSNRICPPYTYSNAVWQISLFTIDRTNTAVDSLGTNGPADVSYKFGVDTSQLVNTRYTKPATNSTTQNPSAQIVGIEVFSTP